MHFAVSLQLIVYCAETQKKLQQTTNEVTTSSLIKENLKYNIVREYTVQCSWSQMKSKVLDIPQILVFVLCSYF